MDSKATSVRYRIILLTAMVGLCLLTGLGLAPRLKVGSGLETRQRFESPTVDNNPIKDDGFAPDQYEQSSPSAEGPPMAVLTAEQVMEKPSGNRGFLVELEKFRHSLYSEGPKVIESELKKLFTTPAPVWRAPSKVVRWFPVQCSALGIDLQVLGKIVYKNRKKNAVFRAADQKTDKMYAYKQFGNADDYAAELTFNMLVDHKYFAKPVCIQHDLRNRMRPGLVFELIEGESSLNYAYRTGTTVADLKRISLQLLEAISHVHYLGFVHTDLKPDNIMVDREGNVKLIDFGYAVALPYSHIGRGNPTILAPEVSKTLLEDVPVDEGLDYWAVGSTLATWFAPKYLPSHAYGKKYVMTEISHRNGYRFGRVPKELPAELRALLYVLTSPNPRLRRFNTAPLLKWLKEHRFFQPSERSAAASQQSADTGREQKE